MVHTFPILDGAAVECFGAELQNRERSAATVEQYLRTLRRLAAVLSDGRATAETLRAWKSAAAERYAASTVNCMIAAVNAWLDFSGAPGLKLRTLRRQRRTFSEHELTEPDFAALLSQARRTDPNTAALLEAMSATGVRVSEVRFLTVEAAARRMAVIRLKGKTRELPLGESLCRRLLSYAKAHGIASGSIFLSKGGRPLDRRRIWEKLKALAKGAGVDPKRVRPHALRHLFARAFYGETRDLAKLADILGHSSVETTRIYVATTCTEHRALMEHLSRRFFPPGKTKKPPRRGGWT